jgi:hypothetical protein
MRRIKLTQGKYAFVDDTDYVSLSNYNWHASFYKGVWYAERSSKKDEGKRHTIRMHRQIMTLKRKDGRCVDHKDGNGLNNQRFNLRMCNHSENNRNKVRFTKGTSVFKGVCWCNTRYIWRAYITYRGIHHFLGYFDLEMDAAKAYNKAARHYFGEYACLNQV